MPRRPTPLPAELGAVFRTADAGAAGVSRGRLAAADLDHPYRGIRVRRELVQGSGAQREQPTPDDRAREQILARVAAHCPLLPDHAFYIGSAAIALHGLPFADAHHALTDDLDVAVFAPHRAFRRAGIRSLQVQPGLARTTVRRGVRVASPATTWALLGRERSERELVHLGDAIVRVPRDDRERRHPELQSASPAALRSALDAGRRIGGDRLRRALARIREGSMSPLETDWRLNLEGTDLPDPILDIEIRTREGRLLGISDGAFPEFAVAVEIEGDHHRSSRRQWNRDIEKYAAYAAIGWETVRLTSAHIRGPGHHDVDLVRDALVRRGWRAAR